MDGNKWNNGDKLKELVSGLEGVVMVVAFYSTGCIHYGLAPTKTNKDGTLIDWEWIDQSRLELVKKEAVKFSIEEKNPSGPFPSGPQA